jgi:hypothetical protein
VTALKTYIVSAILAIVFNAQDTLWATPNHPFWHKGHYVEASALHAGDTIEALEGDYCRLQQIIPISGERRVYNITVAENSNYYVGNRGILVHNDCFLKRLTDSPELMARIDALPDALKGQFIRDFYEAGEDVIKVLKERAGCVRAWEDLLDEDVDPSVRKNIDALADSDAAIDAIQITGKRTWPEIRAFWKRGNDFNAKGRAKYTDDYVEIVLKGVNGKPGKQLDTYLPPSNENPSKIISRKATTLSEIQPNTFKNYLNELITKYPKGAELNSSKFPPGTILDGDYKLEIPESNRLFFESSEVFQNVLSNFNTTKGVNIEIIYLVE